ncbi:MAG TPA: Bax inhibitor-1/YccA family protein [Candidatus Thalassarchaeaceae archaeon]|nr:Bax inhibitor-1/YccA family protein [Candidatus Thalassarchaeaceae archaeon]
MMRSGNPYLNDDSFGFGTGQNRMTLEGVANKTMLLLGICVFTAFVSWTTITVNPELGTILFFLGVIGSLIAAISMWFIDKRKAVYIGPIYAAFEGLFLGPFSGIMETFFPGIIVQAVGLTFGLFFTMLVVYRARLIRPSENLAIGLASAIGAIMLIYMASFVLAIASPYQIPYIHGNGIIGIGFSLFVITVGALTFVMDFDFIEKGVEQGAPKHLEWYAAFGLMITLVWLYIEILRLLTKLRSR